MNRATLLFLFSTLTFGSSAFALDYYVAATGNDGNAGTSGAPFREIRKALTVITAGGTIFVGDGQYKGFNVSGILGTAANPITIKATGSGAVVNVTTDRSDNRDTIFVTASSTYVVIDGLTSFNANRAAIRVDQCAHITVRNCTFGNNTVWGIFTDFSDNLLIENNNCYNSAQQHGCYVSNTCTGAIVRGNQFHDNFANGLHMNGDVSQGGVGIITNALVEKNIIYNNGAGGGSGINCDGVQSSIFRNNLIYNAHGAGISLYQTDASQPANNNLIVNNTIDVAADGKWAVQIHSGSQNNTVFNNILVTNSSGHGSIHCDGASNLVGLVCDYNVLTTNSHCVTTDDDATYLTFAGWKAKNFDAHSLTATQANLFVNSASADYHLKSGSPAIDVGIASLNSKSAPTDDLEGKTRPSGTTYDIGSYEVQSAVPSITTTSPLPAGTVGTAYSKTFAASGGTAPYSWSITSGTLQAGLTLSADGVLSGTPTASGTVSITVQVKDSLNATGSKIFSLTITPQLTVTTTSPLPTGTVNSPYSQSLAATGGTPGYSWSITTGSLPAGITLSTGGLLSGTPTAAGTFNFTVKVTDSVSGTATKALSLTINNIPLTITTSSPLPGGTVNTAYSTTLVALGGSPAYTFTLTVGTLPAGLSLSTGGVISGTPTAAGTSNFTVKVTDSVAASVTKAFALTIAPPTPVLTSISVTPTSTTVHAPKTQQFSATGIDQFGNALSPQPTFSWSVSGGGTISATGLFTASGPAGTYTVTAFSGGISGTASVKVTVPPHISSLPAADASPVVVNVSANYTVSATDPSGGTVSYQWDFGDGTAGSGGSLAHTYTSVGVYTATVTITNSSGDVTISTLTVTVVAGSIQMTVSKLQGTVKFSASGHDGVSATGIIPKLPKLFDTTGQTLSVDLSGAMATFKLDGKGRGKTAQGTIALKLKPSIRNKTTKKLEFQGGDVQFALKLHNGSWAGGWGMSSTASAANAPMTLNATIQLGGSTYVAPVSVKYSAKANVGGKFKK